jgi:ribosomal protein S6--L-glutamate ligase
MRIGILTSLPSFENKENLLFIKAGEKLGHTVEIVDIKKVDLNISEFTYDRKPLKFFDYIIYRAINDIKKAVTISQYLDDFKVKYFDNNMLYTKYAINKLYDSYVIQKSGLPYPKTYEYNDNIDIKYPVIAKKINSMQGKGVFMVKNRDDLKELLFSDLSHHYIIQEYIPYTKDLRVFIIGNKEFAMERIPKKGQFKANYHMGATVKRIELSKKIIDLAHSAAETLNAKIAGVDILLENDLAYILEVNRTPGISGISKAVDKNIAEDILEYCLDGEKD